MITISPIYCSSLLQNQVRAAFNEMSTVLVGFYILYWVIIPPSSISSPNSNVYLQYDILLCDRDAIALCQHLSLSIHLHDGDISFHPYDFCYLHYYTSLMQYTLYTRVQGLLAIWKRSHSNIIYAHFVTCSVSCSKVIPESWFTSHGGAK